MELTIALAITIINCVLGILSFASSKKKEALQNAKENHQELIEYQLAELKENNKEMSNDIKDIKKMLDTYKETFREMIKSEIEEHIKMFHSKEK